MQDDVQSRVIAFLKRRETYNLSAGEVRCIQTHGALVFLAGENAYKMKRAVTFAYLDFSTLDKRETACRHELERNMAFAPELYLDVVPVVEDASGNLRLDGSGAALEWLVRMRRFEQSELFDARAARDDLDIAVMTPLADRIAAFHKAASVAAPQDAKGRLLRILRDTTETLRRVPHVVSAQEVNCFETSAQNFLAKSGAHLDLRARDGMVRHCHGDLHLQNIVLLDGQPVLFDAIEFDDDIATIDVLYDLAFLLMDLWHRDLTAHANVCFNRYMSVDPAQIAQSGLEVLPIFLAMRAGIRAMVAVDRLTTSEMRAGSQGEAARQDIKDYVRLAERFLQPAVPTLIVIGGRSGTGKSTVAAALAPEVGRAPGAVHIRSDVERKRHFGRDPLQSLPAESYQENVSEEIYAVLLERARRVLMSGHAVILDATYLATRHRQAVEAVARDTGAAFHGIWLDAPEGDLLKRVQQRQNDASDADVSVVKKQGMRDIGANTWAAVDARGDIDTVVARVRQVVLGG